MKNTNEFGLYLRERAHWTNDIITKSAMFRLGIMEETITDMHLFSIADEFSNNVLTKKFTRREEGAKSGADWLWIIGEPGSWLSLLIQAKIINPQTGNCQHFDYKNGDQRKRLLYYARQHGCVPLYCVYSSIPAAFEPPEHFKQDGHVREDWACSFVSPRIVRLLSKEGMKNQYEILKYAIPWMDPFCLASTYDTPNGKSIATSIENIRDNFEKEKVYKLTGKVHGKTFLQKRTSWENLDATHVVRESIPKNICKWFMNQSSVFSQAPLSSASIISSVPIEQIKELNI